MPTRTALGLLLLLSACQGFGNMGVADATCSEDFACAEDRVCVEGECVAPCLDDDQCLGAGTFCFEGACRTWIQRPCSEDAACPASWYCTNLGACAPRLADGATCGQEGSSSCASGYCDGQRCCSEGECCQSDDDCPGDDDLWCADTSPQTSCQGQRRRSACRDHVCVRELVDDDRGCAGLVHACDDRLAPIVCGDSIDQSPPSCPGLCSHDGDCAPGFQCVAGSCEVPLGAGEPCTGLGQGSCEPGLKCENGVCCGAGGPSCCLDSESCVGGLACDPVTSACLTACNSGSNGECASPEDQYCENNACRRRKDPGESCEHPGECASLACTCADDACSFRRCTDHPCGVCELTTSGRDCQATVGTSARVQIPGECSNERSCYAGACLLNNGASCAANGECAGTCIGGACASRSGVRGDCDDDDDCIGTSTCNGGRCLLPAGSACFASDECLHNCVAGTCRYANSFERTGCTEDGATYTWGNSDCDHIPTGSIHGAQVISLPADAEVRFGDAWPDDWHGVDNLWARWTTRLISNYSNIGSRRLWFAFLSERLASFPRIEVMPFGNRLYLRCDYDTPANETFGVQEGVAHQIVVGVDKAEGRAWLYVDGALIDTCTGTGFAADGWMWESPGSMTFEHDDLRIMPGPPPLNTAGQEGSASW